MAGILLLSVPGLTRRIDWGFDSHGRHDVMVVVLVVIDHRLGATICPCSFVSSLLLTFVRKHLAAYDASTFQLLYSLLESILSP